MRCAIDAMWGGDLINFSNSALLNNGNKFIESYAGGIHDCAWIIHNIVRKYIDKGYKTC